MAEAAKATDGDAVPDLGAEADALIAERGARGAVLALLTQLRLIENELAMTKPVVSYGFSRGWHHRTH